MNEKDFYNESIKPFLTKDRAANRQFYNDLKDVLNKSNIITDKEANKWCYPSNKHFMSEEEIKNSKKKFKED